jgi:NAD(P)-dependent dehydrogenase (short-subunit alcohol dehydrogenase family)
MFAELTKTLHHDVYPAIDPKSKLVGSMKGKNILITGTTLSCFRLTLGAGRGIGRAIAQSFAQAGAKGIFLISRTEAELISTQRLLHEENKQVATAYHVGSIAKEDEVKEIFREATGLFGSLDVLVYHPYI